MTINLKRCKKSRGLPAVCILLVTLCLASLMACSTKFIKLDKYGDLRKDKAITDEFKSSKVRDDYNYYYYGTIEKPDVVIGLNPGYTFEDRCWKPVNFTATSMNSLVDRMWNKNNIAFHGSIILDYSGNDIGIWYSDITAASIKFEDDNRVSTFYPYQADWHQEFQLHGQHL